ncbi:MAG TPA: putative lipid II flippase FtsW [Candidatus Binataceae bacterium]|nr:putative lipid II flippase FtsW [Candidatus Binataceae bacterium]
MRREAKSLRSWFGRFEVVAQRGLDPWLLIPAGALVIVGCLMVLNTTYFPALENTGDAFHFFKLHLIHLVAGLCVLAIVSQFSLKGLRRIVMPLAIVSIGMLLMLWIPHLGVMRGGARRWLRIGPLLWEPVEGVKFALVFFLADFLSRRQDRIRSFAHGPLAAATCVLPVAIVVLKQPDFGSTVMIALILFSMLWAAGAESKHLAGGGATAVAILALQAVTKSYRMRRLSAFLNPWDSARGAGFQLVQSFIALGAGGGWGVGLGEGRQKMFYLPQAHTDFVFAVIGEEFGVVGAAIVIGLFCAILFRGMKIAHDEPDPFASLLAVGLSALLSFQALINMAVVVGMVPTKGLPLPFVSYGGTAMVMAMAALGALLALARRPAVR